MNTTCFYVVLATKCGPKKAINGPESKNDCFKGKVLSQITQSACLEKEVLYLKKERFKEGSKMLLSC